MFYRVVDVSLIVCCCITFSGKALPAAVADFRFSSSTGSLTTGNPLGNYRNCGIANPVQCTYPEEGKFGGKVLSWAFVFLAMGIGAGMLGFRSMESRRCGSSQVFLFSFPDLVLDCVWHAPGAQQVGELQLFSPPVKENSALICAAGGFPDRPQPAHEDGPGATVTIFPSVPEQPESAVPGPTRCWDSSPTRCCKAS